MRTSRQRGAVLGALLALLVSVATIVPLTLAGRSDTLENAGRSAPARRAQLLGPNGAPLRPLPHGESATAGAAPFAVAPPKLKATTNKAGLLSTTVGVPTVALAAYEHAAGVLAGRDPGCRITWEDVAGIGRVESGNGLTWGNQARVTKNGTVVPPIYGPSLDGQDGMPAMPTTDAGRLEHDGKWTRAVGPMQFLPSTWAEYAQDGNGDGQRNPQNFYDAALTTAVFLCTNGGDLAKPSDLRAAILAYNHSTAYYQLVDSWISFYSRAGAGALLSAGEGLLPLAQTSATTRSTPARKVRHAKGAVHAPPPGHHAPVSPAAELQAAAVATVSKGSYLFTLAGLDGKSTVSTGRGGVDVTDSAGWLDITLPKVGVVQMREVAGITYLSLPASLASAVGAEGPWIVFTPTVATRLPQPLSNGISLASADLLWLVGQFEGAASTVRTVGSSASRANRTTEYAGDVSLPLAEQRVNAARVDLGTVARLLRSPNLAFEAWVYPNKLLQSALMTLGSGFSSAGTFMAQVSFADYGNPVTVQVPSVSPISTTTTTSTTTTSTTTVPSTSTTAAGSTSSTAPGH